MRKPYSFLLVWFSCSVSATRLYGVDYDSVESFDLRLPAKASTSVPCEKSLYDSVETFDLKLPDTAFLSGKLSRLAISPSAKSNQNTLRMLARVSALAEGHSMKELDEALKLFIDSDGMNVAEAGNLLKKLDRQVLHILFAYSYKRSWSDPLFLENNYHKMDWVKFWEVVFEVDNVELFKDLVTQRLPLPFNRLVNLEKAKLSKLVKKYKAPKIGAYLEIPGCKEAIVFDDDGHLDASLLRWDVSGKPFFNMRTVVSVAVKSSNFYFLEKFMSAHPKYFPYHAIATEALLQERFDILKWVHTKSPKEKLDSLDLDLGILSFSRSEERRGLLGWICRHFPRWIPRKSTINKLRSESLKDVLEIYPQCRPVKGDFSDNPSYDLLKWALKHEPGWILINYHTFSIAEKECDLGLFNFIRRNYLASEHGNDISPLAVQRMALKLGDMDTIVLYPSIRKDLEQEYLLAAATNGHVNVLEFLVKSGHKIQPTEDTLIKIANSGHIHVIKYIHKNYSEIFARPFYIDRFLWDPDSSKKQKLKVLKCLYELFTSKNIHPTIYGLESLVDRGELTIFDFILEKQPTIIKDEIQKQSLYAHQQLKYMILATANSKNHKMARFFTSQVQDKIHWNENDILYITKSGAFYILDWLYRDHKERVGSWNPLDYIKEPTYLQWYYSKVRDLPWEDLAFKAALEDHRASLHWILTKNPDVRKALERRLVEARIDHKEKDKVQNALALFDEEDEAMNYYTLKNENPDSIKDEVWLHNSNNELQLRRQSMETTKTL